MTANENTTAIVSHDAGGAEIVSSYVRQQRGNFVYALGGPAIGVFQRKGILAPNLGLDAALAVVDRVLCSTSWQSDLEYRAVQQARQKGIPVAVFLDHWINYRGRLVRGPESLLPDELWVGDRHAEALARKEFPQLAVRQVKNPFFSEIREEAQRIAPPARASDGDVRILYVGEIIAAFSHSVAATVGPFGYTEVDALEYFLAHVGQVFDRVDSITIRPHPAEPPGKYAWVSRKYGEIIRHSVNPPLLQEVAQCDVVVGCESMAMVIGLLAGKRVISSIPPGGKACALPQPEIESLAALLTAGRLP